MNPKPLTKLLLPLAFLLFIVSCKKSSDTDTASTTVSGACGTNPYKVGSIATYSTSSSPYTVNCTAVTVINGKNYIKCQSTVSGSGISYLYVDTNGDIWVYLPAVSGADLPATEMIVSKYGKAVGDSWSYTYPSVATPTLLSYKYTYTVLANNITFTLAGKTYSNCLKVKTTTETFMSGTSMASPQSTSSTWACGLGLIGSEVNGTTYSTLTGYTY